MAAPKGISPFLFNLRRGKNFELTFEEFIFHVEKLPEWMNRAALNFTVVLSKKSESVFKRSFDKDVQGWDGKKWPALSKNTVKKRKWMKKRYQSFTQGPSSKILTNFGILRESIKINKELKYNTGTKVMRRIYADPKDFTRSPIHRGFNYAGVMQTGRPSGGGKIGAIPSRQFMGFSKYIDDWEEKNIDKYLFRAVFTANGKFGMMDTDSLNLLKLK